MHSSICTGAAAMGNSAVDVFICNLCRKCSTWYRQRCSRYMLCGLAQDLFLTVMQIFAKSSRTYSSIFILHQPTTRPKYSASGNESDLATLQAQRDLAMKRKVLTKYRKQTTGSQAGRVETRSRSVHLTLLSIHPSTYDNDHTWRIWRDM